MIHAFKFELNARVLELRGLDRCGVVLDSRKYEPWKGTDASNIYRIEWSNGEAGWVFEDELALDQEFPL